MRADKTYFRAYRSPAAFELIRKHPPTFFLLYVIAFRAQYSEGFNAHNLSQGEAFIGDHDDCGMSEREYRTAKRNLGKWGFSTFKTTNKGTIAKLTDERVFGVLPLHGDGQNDEQETDTRRASDEQATTNNKVKKGKEGLLAAPGSDGELSLGHEPGTKKTAPPKKPRTPDPIFDAIAEVCRMRPGSVTPSAGGQIGNALKEIREVCPEVSPEIIRRVASNYRAAWPGIELPPSALAKHWPRFITEDPALEMARLDAEITKHPGNPRSAAYHPDNTTPEISADFKTKTDRLRQLKQTTQNRSTERT